MIKKLRRGGRLLQNHIKNEGWRGIGLFWQAHVAKAPLLSVKPKGVAHSLYLRNHTTDLPMYDYIFRKKEMDVAVNFTPKVIVDCGGHIGLAAVFFANKFPQAAVYSVEPEASNFELLLKNTKPYPNIHCLPYGIWNKPAHLKIVDAGFGHWGFMTEEVAAKEDGDIEAISIDEIMKRYGLDAIDICKINIEGTEKELFEKNYERWVPKTKVIVVELHDHMREGCTRSFVSAMMNYPFSLYPHGSYLVCSVG